MSIRIKRKNLRRLASLSALGAGVVTLAAGTAEADIVHVNVNQTIDFHSGGPSMGIQVSLPGGAGISLGRNYEFISLVNRFFDTRTPGGRIFYDFFVRNVRSWSLNLGGRALQLSSGAFSKSGAHTGFGQGGFIAGRKIVSYFRFVATPGFTGFRSLVGNPTFTGAFNKFFDPYRYFLFHFPDNGKTLYGWGQLVGPDASHDLTFVDYAYDDTGAPVAPGQTTPAVPEPSEAVPLALGALVLGAAGVRRWRGTKAA